MGPELRRRGLTCSGEALTSSIVTEVATTTDDVTTLPLATIKESSATTCAVDLRRWRSGP